MAKISERFIKFIPSEKSIEFALKYKNAFILLMIIAERARRTDGHLDGIKPGQCYLGSHKNYKMTEKEYRYAKKILVDHKLIKIVLTNRTKKIGVKNREFKKCDFGATSGATSLTTTGTIVELCNSEIWDINLETPNQQKGDLKGDFGATSGRQTRKKKKEEEKNHLSDSSFLTDDPLSCEKGGEREQIAPNVFLSQKELDECIAIKGSREAVIESIEIIINDPKRKYEIKDWPGTLSRWSVNKNKSALTKSISREKENNEFANKLCSVYKKFEDGRGWQCAKYHNNLLDENGIIFEPQSAYKEAFFVALADGQFKEKCEKFIAENIKIDR